MSGDSDDLREWFEREGLTRRLIEYSAGEGLNERVCDPLIALGPGDGDFVAAPHPADCGWPGIPLVVMTLDEYNVFLFRWLEAAVREGRVRCAHCGKLILDGDDLPDPDTWDAIFIEKELVAWMLVHFDCKRWLAKKLKGMQPFDLPAGVTPLIDLSALTPDQTERPPDVGTLD
ncbi:MAG TPA: hypothetical protein VF808_05160 [Ktedonobacterales bacterium]